MRHINYHHLFYFWTVAREGSIARASELLHLTPQTISGQLQVLEESVGAKLFTRVGRRLVLSDTGRVAMNYAEEIFRLGSELGDVLKGRHTGQTLPFTVGIVDVVPKMIAYRLLEPALHLPQPARIICREGKMDTLLADLALHKLDMVLADTPLDPSANVKAFNHLLGECGMTFFATSKIARKYGAGFPQSLHGAPMLLPATNTALRGSLMQWFDAKCLQPQIVGEFEDSALMKAFGQAGVGIFVAPSVIKEEIAGKYDVKAIGQAEDVRERFYAISTERRLRHPATLAVSAAARLEMFRS